MQIRVIPINEFRASVEVDGVKVGEANDCDGRFIVLGENVPEFLDGAFPARNFGELAYAMCECIDAEVTLQVGDEAVDADSYFPR